MKFELDEGAVPAVLSKAILLYTRKPYQYEANADHETLLATIHDVREMGTNGESNVQILSGFPVTKPGLMQALGHLADNYLTTMDLFPENLLGHSPRHMLWWRPARKAPIYFRAGGIGTRSKIIDHPPLLFLVANGKWFVFALKESKRPNLQTEVCMAPYYNVYEDGSICVGSIVLPPEASPSSIPAWEDAFFLSEFTHQNAGPRILNEKGAAAFWCDMLDGVYDTFPLDRLLPQGKKQPVTVASLLEKVSGKGD